MMITDADADAEDGLKSKKSRKQISFKIRFYIGIVPPQNFFDILLKSGNVTVP